MTKRIIEMAVVMKMAPWGKCNKGQMLGKEKNNSLLLAKTTFSRTLRTKLLPQDGGFAKDK